MIPKHPSDCQPDRLLAVLNGRLSLDDEVTMVAHLEDCRACQIALQDLAAEQGEWDTVRQSFAQGVTEADHLGPLEQPLESLLVEDNSVSKFLEPLTDPSKLGRLGEIEILSVIGTGGMGIVLKGYDPALKRYVAVKFWHPPTLSTRKLAHGFVARPNRWPPSLANMSFPFTLFAPTIRPRIL